MSRERRSIFSLRCQSWRPENNLLRCTFSLQTSNLSHRSYYTDSVINEIALELLTRPCTITSFCTTWGVVHFLIINMPLEGILGNLYFRVWVNILNWKENPRAKVMHSAMESSLGCRINLRSQIGTQNDRSHMGFGGGGVYRFSDQPSYDYTNNAGFLCRTLSAHWLCTCTEPTENGELPTDSNHSTE